MSWFANEGSGKISVEKGPLDLAIWRLLVTLTVFWWSCVDET